MTTLISLADAKTHLRIDQAQTTQDAELTLYLTAIGDVVQAVCGPVMVATFTDIREATDTIVLDKAPITGVTSIVVAFPTYPTAAFVPAYSAELKTGILRQTLGPNDPAYAFQIEPFYGQFGLRLAITYTAGYATVPAGLQLAVRMILGELWDARRGAGPSSVRGNAEELPIPSNDDILSTDAIELLRPFKLKGPKVA